MEKNNRIFAHGEEVTVEPYKGAFAEEAGVSYYRITLDYAQPTVPHNVRISWFERLEDGFTVWTPGGGFDRGFRPSWRPVGTDSRSASGAPLIAVVSSRGKNVASAALSDAGTPSRMTAGIEESNGKIRFVVQLFTCLTEAVTHYETLLRVDISDRPYYESLKSIRRFWTEVGYAPAYVPVDAKRAMFSSWYCFQKDVDGERLLKQCAVAKEYGMDTVILDDGWQTDEVQSGYTRCGDWEPVPSKFPDMRRFVDRLHGMGMKCILWYSVPFVGKYAKNVDRFRGMYLRARDREETVMILDPRFAEVRHWLTETYKRAVSDWALDGLKLDFIDSFSLAPDSPENYDAMDCPSLEAAVEKLLSEIMTELKKINPEIMIEFRQSYIGPVMQKYGNMLRVGDCAGGAIINRVNGLTLRLLTESTAVHSDMLLWDYDAKPENAADQLSNILFLVPQISVMPEKLSDPHRLMLKHYLNFMDINRDVLLDGYLVPLAPEANYGQVYAGKDGRVIAALYENPLFEIPDGTKTLTVVNAGASDCVVLCGTDRKGGALWTVTDCMGNPVDEGKLGNQDKIVSFAVPHNGFLTVTTCDQNRK